MAGEGPDKLVERQSRYLGSREGVDWLVALPGWLRALDGDPRLAVHLNDLRREADALGRGQIAAECGEGGADGRLLDYLWDGLMAAQPPGHWLASTAPAYRQLYADLEHPAVVALDPQVSKDAGRLGGMIALLDDAISNVGGLPESVAGSTASLETLRHAQTKRHARLLRVTRQHPGVGLLRLELLSTLAQEPSTCPAHFSLPSEDSDRPALEVRELGGRRWPELIAEAVNAPDAPTPAQLPGLIGRLAPAAELLELELRRRIGTTRSRVALIDRYRVRAQTHDRERLQLLADEPGRREDRLRDDLARYLFDAGLDPLTEVRLGTVARADIVATSGIGGFLLEAKQYGDRASIEAVLRQAFRQALDTAGALEQPMKANEAFIVLFRRSGPRALLPSEPIEADGLRWYFRLVDLAPAAESASRSPQDPQPLSTDRLRSLLAAAHETPPQA